MITQNEYNASLQLQRKLYVQCYLLNYKFQRVDELSGVLLSHNYSINSSSDIRRTCNIVFYPKDSSFDIKSGNKIWLDKYINIYIGIEDIRTGEVIYTNMGIYLINNPSQIYNATTDTIEIQGVDLMAKMTGLRNGNLEGIEYVIPEGSNIRDAIIAVVKESGFNNYIVKINEEDEQVTPYEIRIDIGGTIYDILEELNNINPNYQMFFDVNGVFNFIPIPSGYEEQVMLEYEYFNELMIEFSSNTSFEDLKNVIEVFGKTHDVKYYGGTATVSGNNYNISIADVTKLRNNLKVGFTSPSKIESPNLNINNLGAYPIKEKGQYADLSNEETYYVVKLRMKDDEGNDLQPSEYYYEFMGELTPYAIIKETNPESPFYVNGTVGEIRIVLSGGEYDNINKKTLAEARAKWELYQRCRLLDSITISMIPCYFMDVNWVVEIQNPKTKEIGLYIVKSISTDCSSVTGTQTVSLMKFYPYYYQSLEERNKK